MSFKKGYKDTHLKEITQKKSGLTKTAFNSLQKLIRLLLEKYQKMYLYFLAHGNINQ